MASAAEKKQHSIEPLVLGYTRISCTLCGEHVGISNWETQQFLEELCIARGLPEDRIAAIRRSRAKRYKKMADGDS